MNYEQFLPPALGAVLGVGLKWAYDAIAERYRFRREMRENDKIDVTGEWYAAWQTSVDGSELVNTEHITMRQKGRTVRIQNLEISPENPIAGFLWDAQMQFFQGRAMMGWYFPTEQKRNASKGMLYITYLSQRQLFFGKWVGMAYDGELLTGCVVIATTREGARSELEAFIKKHPQPVCLISYGI